MQTQILRLNKAGQAIEWVGLETAACLYTKNQVVWSYGQIATRLHGGYSRLTGKQSLLDIASVIATDGFMHADDMMSPCLSNIALFQRDEFICLYCGKNFGRNLLTRDHVIPKGKGGKDIWENCVSACKACNNHKACRTPEEANMRLLAIPFRPNKAEYLALANRHILTDQMEFLVKGFSKNMRKRI